MKTISCKFCNKELSDVLGIINHNCEKIDSGKIWKGKIHSGNLFRNSKLIQ